MDWLEAIRLFFINIYEKNVNFVTTYRIFVTYITRFYN